MSDPIANGPPISATAMPSEGGLRAPPGLSRLGKFWWWVKFWLFVKTARLRFIAVLLAVGAVIAYWDTLRAYYEKWTRPAATRAVAGADLEFWCPMHPTIVREHPDKCPICGMPLSKRKKGEAGAEEPLPPGVVSRVQLSPYRVALAGIQTFEVDYRPLARQLRAVGFVEFDERRLARITARVTGKNRIDRLYANVTGQLVHKDQPLAELYSPDLVVTVQNLLDARNNSNPLLEKMARERLLLWGIDGQQIQRFLSQGTPITHVTIRSPIGGHVIKKYQVEGEYVEEGARLYDVADLSTIWIEAQVYEEDLPFLKEGLAITATTRGLPGREFTGRIAFMHPHLDAATRTLRVRFDVANHEHELRPGMYATVALEVPVADLDQFQRRRLEEWRNRALANALAQPLGPADTLGLGSLLFAASSQAQASRQLVLAVPESAVIDTGTRRIVYRQSEPGVYEGVEVQLGPRCGEFYPVVSGLQPGQRVATAGSFLIDAETRLTGGLGSTYFGASGGPPGEKRGSTIRPSSTEDEEAKIHANLTRLSPSDQRLAEAQKFCPVLVNNRLGVMGKPAKILLNGEPVFLCCKGCESEARAHAAHTLERVARFKAGSPAKTPSPEKLTPEEAHIRAELNKLKPEDRRLASAQGFCAVQSKNRLGSMGTPTRVLIQGQPVFLCCDGCVEEARAHPTQTLARVQKLKNGRHQP